jgi:hypothetical protein
MKVDLTGYGRVDGRRLALELNPRVKLLQEP